MSNESWEVISEKASRMKIEDGWIVCYQFEGAKSSIFIPDSTHQWKA